jgi:hypothetical protein
LLVGGCSTINRAYYDDYGRLTPVNPKFRFLKYLGAGESNNLIRTNAIYITKSSGNFGLIGPGEKTNYWVFLRFLPNGEFYSSTAIKDEPGEFEFSSMPKGHIGYWTILNDSIVRAEFFSPKEFNCYVQEDFVVNQQGVLRPIRSRIRSFGTMWSKSGTIFFHPFEVENLPDSIPR